VRIMSFPGMTPWWDNFILNH